MNRHKVAMHASELLQRKFSDRVERASTEGMRVTPQACPSVLKVAHTSRGKRSVNHVLMGLHRGMTFFDDDHLRGKGGYRPRGGGVGFVLTKGTALYEGLPGLVPVACTCPDYVRRCTTGGGGVPSVNVEEGRSDEYTAMGAVLGCKHMIRVQEWLERDPAAGAYFGGERGGGNTAP